MSDEMIAPDAKVIIPEGGAPLKDVDGEVIGRVIEAKPDGHGGLVVIAEVEGRRIQWGAIDSWVIEEESDHG